MKIYNILEDKYDELPDDDKFAETEHIVSYLISLNPGFLIEICYIENNDDYSNFIYYCGEQAIEANTMYNLCLKVQSETFFERFLYQIYEHVLVSGKCDSMKHMDLLNKIAGKRIDDARNFVKFMTENINYTQIIPFWQYVDDMLLPM